MTDNFPEIHDWRSIALEARHDTALRETLDRLRLEVAELRASRERLVLAGDADRRRLERDLHQGAQQHLVALAVNLQHARGLADADPAAVKELLQELAREVQEALDETAELAQRIYPPLLEAGGLAVALRSAAASAGVAASVDVSAAASYPPEVAGTVYFCCLEAIQQAGAGVKTTVTVRDEGGTLTFEVASDGECFDAGFDQLRDRVEALGGRLTIRSEPGRGTRVSGSLPLSR